MSNQEIQMKASLFLTRLGMWANKGANAPKAQERRSRISHSGEDLHRDKRSRAERKELFYYQQVIDPETQRIVGHLADISAGGFRLDSQEPLPVNRDFRFHLSLTSELADKPFMAIVARSCWCKVDPLDPTVYNIGCQLIQVSPEDLVILNRMMEKYGRERGNRYIDLRRSNKW
jgi:hypothetical protein